MLIALVVDAFFFLFAGIVVWCTKREFEILKYEASQLALTVKSALTLDIEVLGPEQRVLGLLEGAIAQSGDLGASGLATKQTWFPVLDGGRLVGVVERVELLRGVRGGREDVLVRDVMQPPTQWVEAGAPLGVTVEKMREMKVAVVCVVEGGMFVGVLRVEMGEDLVPGGLDDAA